MKPRQYETQAEIIEGIKRGLEDLRAGRLVPHEQAMAELDTAIAVSKPLPTRKPS
jgi:predicted transcriptional regulator